MSIENTNVEATIKTEVTEPVEQQQTEKQYSAIEQKAIEQGWVPKDDFEGEEGEFIDAPEFVRRGELFAKIESSGKKIKKLEEALEAMKTFNGKIQEQAYKKALRELNDARKRAMVDGETETALALEEKIEQVKEEKAEFDASLEQVPTRVQTNEVFENWQANNPWYGKDKAMTSFANGLGQEFRDQVLAGAMTQEQAFIEIAKQVKQEFKHKFANPKASRQGAVEAPSRGGRSGFSNDKFQLTDDERTIMRKIVSTGVMSEQDYIKQLKETREV